MLDYNKVAVVIPAFRCAKFISGVCGKIDPRIKKIYVVDDACPEQSGRAAEALQDPRITVLAHARNLGVGGAMKTGYKQAAADGFEIVVKIDGDGQMDPGIAHKFIAPILQREADYTKGNRFFKMSSLKNMPGLRIAGNAGLSFLAKISTGYWHLVDPTNGYTAIHANLIKTVEWEKVNDRYFFETDLLFRLGEQKAVVKDIPIDSFYGEEKSNLREFSEVPRFIRGHFKNTCRRLFYEYFIRDFCVASLELIIGLFLLGCGVAFGLAAWIYLSIHGIVASPGTVMLSVLPILLGTQFILNFINYDISKIPKAVVYPTL